MAFSGVSGGSFNNCWFCGMISWGVFPGCRVGVTGGYSHYGSMVA